ncbi:Spore protein SP21 [bacterium HR29]|jgi:HSP20 family protein|nr:Spore protein SP21 [bacterium HR29]
MAREVVTWDPFRELAAWRERLQRLFGEWPEVGEFEGTAGLAIDVYQDDRGYVVKAAVPGVKPEDVEITVDDDVLRIKAESKQEEEVKEDRYLRREIRWGAVQRALRLPPDVDVDKIEASFENGILTLRLPRKPEAKPRTIKVQAKG